MLDDATIYARIVFKNNLYRYSFYFVSNESHHGEFEFDASCDCKKKNSVKVEKL